MGIFNRMTKRSYTPPFVVNINQNGTALRSIKNNSIALACMDIIGTCVASLPIDVYKKSAQGREKIQNDISKVIKRPNIDEPKSIFYYSIVKDYFNSGNIYLHKTYNGSGILNGLYRLDADKVEVKRDDSNRKVYSYSGNTYTSFNILHIPSRYGYNGLKGQSIFSYYSGAFELALALDEYFKKSFSNGFGNGKRLLLDLSEMIDNGNMSKEEKENIRRLFIDSFAGYQHADEPIIKTVKKAKYETLDVGTTSNKEQQLSENINVTQELITKIFNVPSSFLKGKNEYNGLESLYQILLDFAVRPVVDNIIDGFTSLLNPEDLDRIYIEPNYNALMRLNVADKFEAYNKQLGNGSLTINEARAMENKSSIGPAGDIPNIPANLIPLTMDVVDARLATQKLALKQYDNNSEKTGEY